MTWAPSFGPARPTPVPSAPPIVHKPYSPPVDLRKKVQGDIVYTDECQRTIPVPTFVEPEPTEENAA